MNREEDNEDGNSEPEYYEDDYFQGYSIVNPNRVREEEEKREQEEDMYLSEDYNYLFRADQIFSSRNAAKKYVDAIGYANKMAFYIASSCPGRTVLRCERGEKPRTKKKTNRVSVSNQRKSSGSKKQQCTFRILLKERKENEWMVVVTEGLGRHNHPNAYYLHGHTLHARLQPDEIAFISESMNAPGAKLKGIMSNLKKKFKKNVSTRKHFENAIGKLRREEMDGRSKMDVLFDCIRKGKYEYAYLPRPNSNTLGSLIFAPPEAKNLIRLNPRVVVMDATYQTNAAHLPLVEIIGIVSTGNNFHLAFAFISDEKTHSYLWTMRWLKALFDSCKAQGPKVIVTDRELASIKAINEVFTGVAHLLCRRHIKMDCQSYLATVTGTKKYERTFSARWDAVVFESTEAAYEDAVIALKNSFHRHRSFLSYLDRIWLIPYRDRFVSAWTKQYMHFGTETTNRVEGSNFQYKHILGTSNNGLIRCFEMLAYLVTYQHDEIKKSFEFSLTTAHLHCKHLLFRRLKNKVSRKAIEIMHEELAKCDDPALCTCELRGTHGLPCAYEMIRLRNANRPIDPKKDVDIFWRTLHMEGDVVNIDETNARQVFNDIATLYAANPTAEDLLMQANFLHQRMQTQSCDLDEPCAVKSKGRPKNAVGSRVLSGWERQAKEIQDKERHEKRQEKNKWTHNKTEEKEKEIEKTEKETAESRPQKRKKQNYRRTNTRQMDSTVYPLVDIYRQFVDDFLCDWEDVMADGNCGPRTLARIIYGDQNYHPRVRTDIYQELVTNPRYRQILSDDFAYALRIVQTDHEWFDFFYIGPAVATKYQMILNVQSSYAGSVSYWPLSWHANMDSPPPEISIGHVMHNPRNEAVTPTDRRNHFIVLRVKEMTPMPPTTLGWSRISDPALHIWRQHFGDRQRAWNNMEVRTRTPISRINLDP